MSTIAAVPLLEYLATIYRPDCEFLDGGLLERNLGEWDHSRLQMLIARYLCNREQQWGILVACGQRLQVKPTRFRIPNILVLTGPRPSSGIVTHPPFLCVEILSPSDRMSEMQERISDYLNFGVTYVWVVDPLTRRAFIYTSEAMHEVKDGVLRTSNPEISVPFRELD